MTALPSLAEIGVIGAGLSGLAAAALLVEAGRSVQVIEAKAKPGGRIQSVVDGDGRYLADLGPTWVWPTFQPTITRWIEKLGLTTFEQFEQGLTVIDHGPDQGTETRFMPGQVGNLRLECGPQAMIDRLADRLQETVIQTSSPVVEVDLTGDRIKLRIDGAPKPTHLTVDTLIVATPPRIALTSIDWLPALPQARRNALSALPTWMAPHAKVVILYERAFWRERGLSGRIFSRAGPLIEAHDHSGPRGDPAAIFGFVGWPHDLRAELGTDLETHVRDQLKRCFGTDSPTPISIHITDWAADAWVTSSQDLTDPMDHPRVGPAFLREAHAEGRVWFAGSEIAAQSPGLIEGAFAAADNAVSNIIQAKSSG